MPFIVKTSAPPAYLKTRVAFLKVPCVKSIMWCAEQKDATRWGDREDAKKAAALTQVVGCSVEEVGDTPMPAAKKTSPRVSGDSIFD